MTNISNFVSTEPTRILETLAKTDPTTDAYGTGLQNLAFLMDVIPNFDSIVQDTQPAAESKVLSFENFTAPATATIAADRSMFEPSKNDEPEEEAEFTVSVGIDRSIFEPEPETEPEPEAPSITKEELRGKLAAYSNAHANLDIPALMSGMGYSKLSDIPAERYAELLEKVEQSIGGDK